jgi:PGF-pre-PGF domain-containing protein
MVKKNQKKSFITSSIITILIVAILILSGPVGAVIVSIVGLDGSLITQGNSKTFDITVQLQDHDTNVPVSNLSLNISGNTPISCVFNTGGIILSGCTGITINATSPMNSSYYGYGTRFGYDNTFGYGYGYPFGTGYGYGYPFGTGYGYGYSFGTGYGYGYGYGYGGGNVTFTYRITFSTSGMATGAYTATTYLNVAGNATKPYFASSVASFTIVAPSSSGGGGGSSGSVGGGGVVSFEPYDNIARSETYNNNLVSNKSVLYTFKLPEHGIYEIAVTGKESENNIDLKVEALKGPTKIAGISAPPGTVYKNVNVWAGSKGIKEALIRFKVENTWIANNKIAGSDLLMVRWNGKEWAKLDTSELKKDDTYTFYEAKTEGFSSFAITVLKGKVVPGVTPASGVTEIAGTPVKPAATKTATPVPTRKTPGFEAIIAVSAIAMLAALLKNNRQRR